ncbi:hypothetical protein BLNAU_1098 [Blattamonas nauphoetae]|uniref:Uncharacterized protein n=1 Tax=Blattamonas nauphoetae TaxID=2049346 RepID=A0ABQ9YJU9_9EUKA|nr:hypothetical protein BLNAU_1098 [Blattamonas nauphoetae]
MELYLCFDGSVRLGFLDSTCPVPKLDDALGYNVQNSLSLFSFVGHVSVCNESTGLTGKTMNCQMEIKEGDSMEAHSFQDFLRQFGLGYQTTSIRFDRITHQTQPTPITSDMTEYTWE